MPTNYDWVKIAKDRGVSDIGQIPPKDKRKLRAAVKRGELIEDWDHLYPIPKRRWFPTSWLTPSSENLQ